LAILNTSGPYLTLRTILSQVPEKLGGVERMSGVSNYIFVEGCPKKLKGVGRI